MAILWDELRTEVWNRLARRQDISNRIDGWISDAQSILAYSDIELPLLDKTVEVNTIANVGSYVMSAEIADGGFALPDIVGIRQIRNVSKKWRMRRFHISEFRKLHTQPVSSCIRWCRWGNRLFLDPVPPTVEILMIDYRRQPPGVPEVVVQEKDREFLIRFACHIGWNALLGMDEARAQYSMLPPPWQRAIANPLSEAEWEAMWDEDLALVPDMSMYG